MESFLIAENYVPKSELQTVASAVLLAQYLKEESWNSTRYTKTDAQASKEAVERFELPEIWITVIHEWNARMWNEAQEWARGFDRADI